ncbi:alanine--tRNA ligase [Flavobacterium quisquiliarum]|uniref:Alanine--tRNA ligase n=1 Tax=Flavobacterium quisquiliarum TaxID=1834436 RepID=A0ABV8W473_9FLAO|nr:alanine--tRNA ligase [Flavobacterium quisquiliarum]MBW1656866.1 alanine--tRNA ligase [Flavobacterium quisquiliarum]NWK99524.1 alanine--tRNA ligase [Flavobacterium collinsii]
MKSQDVRKQFLDFFESKGHTIVPSAPIVLKDDPTLMFNNSGMAQFKEFFLGNGTPKSPRIADTQKCLRVSGKHNDLEEVGIDTYHHTMFEMLGNWSFGDYFKKEAINWAWELLTEVYKIPKENLYVSVFEGSKEDNVPFDQEAWDIWKELIDEDRIILGNKKDNFWEMGDQGPCGPCSEIHVDLRSEEEKALKPGKEEVNNDHPQVVEIWNNVFMEFNRKADGSLEKLPAQHVDTGMGFERLCMALQGKTSNYDTDVFMPLIREIETITGAKYTTNDVTGISEEQNKMNIAIRVVADHVRAVAFAIADGQLPSNTGAGYVIRRILRRAIRYGFTFLGTKEPFIFKLVETLSEQMGDSFPEIRTQKALCSNVIREEENSFLKTLDQGLILLDAVILNNTGDTVDGKKAFELYDTYGFPIDLTALILSERGLKLDEEGFQEQLQLQKERSRAASKVTAGDWNVLVEDDIQEFVGYDRLSQQVKITKYRRVESAKDGEIFQLVFNATPFYGESGGQTGDKGYLEAQNGDIVYIIDTKKENNQTIHLAKSLPENLTGTFNAVVDANQRAKTSSNHSATHLLHQGLRKILGTHIEQKGSMVRNASLRFDFSHFSKVTDEELVEVENFVNARIRESLPLIEKRGIPKEQALEDGAIALFGEKYGDLVRTIKFGDSVELCGGTHVANTSDIWHFKIVSEGAVAAGIRRIEAITSEAAKEYFESQAVSLAEIKDALKNAQDPVKSILALQDENAQLKKQLEALLKDKAKNMKADLAKELQEINGVQFLAKQVDLNPEGAKDLAYELGGSYSNLFVVFATAHEGKPMLTCYISKEIVAAKNLNAGLVVRELGKYIQGGGGGQPFFATAGGKNVDGIAEALTKAVDFVK